MSREGASSFPAWLSPPTPTGSVILSVSLPALTWPVPLNEKGASQVAHWGPSQPPPSLPSWIGRGSPPGLAPSTQGPGRAQTQRPHSEGQYRWPGGSGPCSEARDTRPALSSICRDLGGPRVLR